MGWDWLSWVIGILRAPSVPMTSDMEIALRHKLPTLFILLYGFMGFGAKIPSEMDVA